MPLLGAHMSVAGGLHLAFERIRQVGGEALQIFTRNQRQWQVASILPAEQVLFQKEREKWGKGPVAAHNSYLINLAAKNEETRIKSVHAMADEIGRVAALGIPYLIMHPGSHGGDGVEAGLDRFVNNLDAAMGSVKQCDDVMVLLENTAGQGTGLGSAFNELSYIINNSRYKERLGVCLDTCHLFAAGYDFRTPEKYKETFQLFETEVGIDRIRFFHINDSKKALGSRVDRHEHIGKGEIGLEGFRNLVNDERFRHHPMTLETPKGKDLLEDIENLAVLKSLIR
jgi:deoxyribonuclease-4